jgi:hypothetical protein
VLKSENGKQTPKQLLKVHERDRRWRKNPKNPEFFFFEKSFFQKTKVHERDRRGWFADRECYAASLRRQTLPRGRSECEMIPWSYELCSGNH